MECWIAGEGGQLPSEVIGPRVLTVLKGRASVIVRHLKVEDVSKADGLRLVLRALEDSPMVRELDGQRGEKAQREFLRCKRLKLARAWTPSSCECKPSVRSRKKKMSRSLWATGFWLATSWTTPRSP